MYNNAYPMMAKPVYTRIVPVLIAAVIFPVTAAKSFTVHRAEDPNSIRAGAPLATVSQGQYDDVPSLLDDGHFYCYLVTDGAQGVAISVHKNTALGTVRIAFDDNNDLSAAVSPIDSTVSVSPQVIPADGSTVSTITIVPRDDYAQPLGTGLTVSLQASALLPGVLSQPLTDQGEGTYTAHVMSAAAGIATVLVDVEGIGLSDTPTLAYEATGQPALPPFEQALSSLEELTAPGGDFDLLIAVLNGPAKSKTSLALGKALDALSELQSWEPVNHWWAVDPMISLAIQKLQGARAQTIEEHFDDIDALIDALLECARLVAMHYLNEALSGCGVCEAGEPAMLCDALAKYDEALEAWGSQPQDAATDLAYAIESAQGALAACP